MEKGIIAADVNLNMSNKQTVQQAIIDLREKIDNSILYKQEIWKKRDTGDFNKFYSSLDNLEDSQKAIAEYKRMKTFRYLTIYGVLQSLYIQQDALRHTEEAMGVKLPNFIEDYPELWEIRQIRNEVAGHPSETGLNRNKSQYEQGAKTYTTISSDSNAEELRYYVWIKDSPKLKIINLKQVVSVQEKLVIKEIVRIMKKVNQREKQHKKNYSGSSISELFKPVSYLIQKLWSFEPSRDYSRVCWKSLKEIYESFKKEVKERYNLDKIAEHETQIPGLVVVIQHLEKIIPRIDGMIAQDEILDELDLDVYVESLDNCFSKLREMAQEIDQEFNH